jgi:hypothetical protein
MLNFMPDKRIFLVILSVFLLLSACGPSEEAMDATRTSVVNDSIQTQTAAAPTQTPTPTPSPTPTPTPLPDPDAKAMINWQELNLPNGYLSLDAAQLGMGEGDWIGRIQKEDGTEVDYYVEQSFVFAEQWPEAAYGWTVLYPTDFDKEVLDYYIDNVDAYLSMLVTDVFQGTLISVFNESDYIDVGDKSGRAWAVYEWGGTFWSFQAAIFRMDDIGGWVFTRQSFGEDPFIEIDKLARIYAQSIEVPMNRCRLVTISPVTDSEFPAYEYKVEGFYPGEPLMVALSGDVRIGGEVKSVVMVDYDTDNAYENGEFHGKMTFNTDMSDEKIDEVVPSDFEFSILGFYSGCELKHSEYWPP